RLILKALIFAALLLFAYLAMTKTVEHYSRFVFGVSFIYMLIVIPVAKRFIKTTLSKMKLWQKRAKIYGDDPFLTKEVYGDPYLGYVKPKPGEKYSAIFINSKDSDLQTLKQRLATQLKKRDEVIYIPIVDEYNLALSHIYELSATRTNLIVYENRLKSWYRQLFQNMVNYLLALLLLPILLPIIGVISLLIKLESPGPVFFVHNRIGKNGKIIPVIKFRSMYQDAKERLEEMLKNDSAIRKEWESCFKLKEDPRVTKVGNFLRKSSLDELPQIFNVFKGEMNFVGPRPVIQDEIDNYYKEDAEYYYMVKPGITGLWQVSGRSDTDYEFRVSTDRWYVTNWTLWLDIMILIKTVGVVLKRDGAY
ncbi:MAG TPA: glycosyl transferase, partial [Nitratifractor sp.]|nr:glycosyl transferase [Nitratifractor sp.]